MDLRADPYEAAPRELMLYLRVRRRQVVLRLDPGRHRDVPQLDRGFPSPRGSSLNAGNINYGTRKAAAAMKRLAEIESLVPPTDR